MSPTPRAVVRRGVDSCGGSAAPEDPLAALGTVEGPGEPDDSELHVGDRVVVEHLSGLTVSVRPAEEWELF